MILVKYDLEKIIDHFPIDVLAEEHGVELENAGSDYVALCPFHDDIKTKSLHIYLYSNSFWCFGCQRGGSIFDFTMLAENVSFAGAVELLAKRMGLSTQTNLEDLNFKQTRYSQEFKDRRESAEKRITVELRNLYFSIKKSSILQNQIVLLNKVNELWRWVDKGYLYFDRKLFQHKMMKKRGCTQEDYEFFVILNEKLTSFYQKFIKKLEEI